MEYDITHMVVGILIGMGMTLAAIAWYVYVIVSRYESQIKDQVRVAVKDIQDRLLPVIVEQEGEEIFVYSEQDRQFLVQGRTAREIRERFDQRFPDRIAYMAGGEQQLVDRLREELKALKEQEKSEVSHSI